MSTPVQAPYAPAPLELVRQLANTTDREQGTDQLATTTSAEQWLSNAGFPGPVTARDLRRITSLRSTVRLAMEANHGRPTVPDEMLTELNAVLAWSGARPEVRASGLNLAPSRPGVRGLSGAIVAAVAVGLAAGNWERLKICTNTECQWAFYDHSRSKTGQWCSMGSCGNRAKQRRWRSRVDD